MKKLLIAAGVAALLSACAGGMSGSGMSGSPMSGGSSVMVGGAAMFPTKDIIDNAVNSKDHTTLVAAVKAAGLVDTLKTPGPFTVLHRPTPRLMRCPPARLRLYSSPRTRPH